MFGEHLPLAAGNTVGNAPTTRNGPSSAHLADAPAWFAPDGVVS